MFNKNKQFPFPLKMPLFQKPDFHQKKNKQFEKERSQNWHLKMEIQLITHLHYFVNKKMKKLRAVTDNWHLKKENAAD